MPVIVVFDTNILVSALLSLRGSPFRCLALAREGVIESVTCEEILTSLRRSYASSLSTLRNGLVLRWLRYAISRAWYPSPIPSESSPLTRMTTR